MSLKPQEQANRDSLRISKPLVYEKMLKLDSKIKRGESIAIIQFQYNYKCNFKCVHCSIQPFQNQNKRSFTIPDVKELSRQADSLGLARFVITGGEPLTFTDLDELVAAIDPTKFFINCDTNGWLLTPEKAIHLKSIGIDRIQLSIDNLYPDQHDSFRRAKGSHKRAMQAVENSLSANLGIFIQTVVTRERLYSDEFIAFLEYFNSKNIGVFVSYAKPVGSWQGNLSNLITKSDIQYMKTLETKHNVFTHLTPAYGLDLGCPAGKNILSITQYGDVLSCPYFHCSMGNVFTEPLSPILDRCMRLKPFKTKTCPLAEDSHFINKYLVDKIYNKSLPVTYTEVFTAEDFE